MEDLFNSDGKYLGKELYSKLIEKEKQIVTTFGDYIMSIERRINNNLKVGDNFFENDSVSSYVTNIHVRPTEIMIGKLYAKELGLLPGDNISDI